MNLNEGQCMKELHLWLEAIETKYKKLENIKVFYSTMQLYI